MLVVNGKNKWASGNDGYVSMRPFLFSAKNIENYIETHPRLNVVPRLWPQICAVLGLDFHIGDVCWCHLFPFLQPVAALIVSHGGVRRWWSSRICTPQREMDFSAWEKWICAPFQRICGGWRKEGVSQLSSCLTFQRQGAARQAVTLAGFTPRRPRQLWNTIATKIDWNMIALK